MSGNLQPVTKRNIRGATWRKTQSPQGHKTIKSFLEETEDRATKKLCPEFSRTENCILGNLLQLDEFHLHPLVQGHCGSAPETSRNALGTNQGTNEGDCQSVLHPEASVRQRDTLAQMTATTEAVSTPAVKLQLQSQIHLG